MTFSPQFPIQTLDGRDQIYGYADNDILVAKGGKDELYGGTGDDLYLVSAADGFKTIIQDDGGYDALNIKDAIISLSLLQSGKVGLYRRDDNNLLIDLNKDGYATTSDDLIINFFFDPTATGDDIIDGQDGDDKLYGTPNHSPIQKSDARITL